MSSMGARTFTPKVLAYDCSDMTVAASRNATPALLTTRSISVSSIFKSCMSDGFERSQDSQTKFSFSMSGFERDTPYTFHESLSRASARSLPIPLLAPVITDVFMFVAYHFLPHANYADIQKCSKCVPLTKNRPVSRTLL